MSTHHPTAMTPIRSTHPPLSPAAQAVKDSLNLDELNGLQQIMARAHAVAALRALASSNAVNVYQDEINCDIEHICVEDILSIAAEMESQP